MESAQIQFIKEDVTLISLDYDTVRQWLTALAKLEHQTIEALNYIFCSDAYLLEMNQKYLAHDTLTDVITFQYHEQNQPVEGDVFISLDRIKENAKLFNKTTENELLRVMAHGLLHLMGYKDKLEADQIQMRELENKALSLWESKKY